MEKSKRFLLLLNVAIASQVWRGLTIANSWKSVQARYPRILFAVGQVPKVKNGLAQGVISELACGIAGTCAMFLTRGHPWNQGICGSDFQHEEILFPSDPGEWCDEWGGDWGTMTALRDLKH